MSVPTSKSGSSLSSNFQNVSGNREFGERVRIKREKLGFTQKHLAEKIGSNKNSVQRYESGALPKGDKLLALSNVLNCSIDWLLKGGIYKSANHDDEDTDIEHQHKPHQNDRPDDTEKNSTVLDQIRRLSRRVRLLEDYSSLLEDRNESLEKALNELREKYDNSDR